MELQLNHKISEAKQQFETVIIESFVKDSSSDIYRKLRHLSKDNEYPVTMVHGDFLADTDTSKANAFNNYFYSIFTRDSDPAVFPVLTFYPIPSFLRLILLSLTNTMFTRNFPLLIHQKLVGQMELALEFWNTVHLACMSRFAIFSSSVFPIMNCLQTGVPTA